MFKQGSTISNQITFSSPVEEDTQRKVFIPLERNFLTESPE